MYSLIHDNLHRQFKALGVLESLLDEEFMLLQNRDAEGITSLEFSIHELLRQIARERITLKDSMQGTRLLEYASMLQEEEGEAVRRLYYLIDSLEQRCARNAGRNAELSLALYDQGQALLEFLHEKINPLCTDVYGAGGKLSQARPTAALISGRL